jgi:hypothetical protein
MLKVGPQDFLAPTPSVKWAKEEEETTFLPLFFLLIF